MKQCGMTFLREYATKRGEKIVRKRKMEERLECKGRRD